MAEMPLAASIFVDLMGLDSSNRESIWCMIWVPAVTIPQLIDAPAPQYV
jgi:hypothetical protein